MSDEVMDGIEAVGSLSTTNLTTGELFITGAKGKSKGGGRGAVEADNTLRSAAVVRVVEVISEGPIEGIAGGPIGILINDTPLLNKDNSFNFPRVAWDYRVGLPVQDYMPGFASASAEVGVSAPVLSTTPVVRTISSASVDAIVMTIELSEGLYKQNTKNGDLNGSTVSFRVDVKLTSSTVWQQFNTYTITGKTTSPYEVQYRVERPAGTSAWDIRVVKLTADSNVSSLKNTIKFSRMTEIIDAKLPYEDTAVVGLSIDAESVGSSIPSRSYMVKGRIIAVPNNYDPVTRTYSGLWSGVFKQAWTDNPAWVLLDLLTHERYGLGEYIKLSDVDIYSFYDAAVYNDGLVSDGKGGTEPRFTFNMVLQTQEDAYQLLSLVAGSFRSNLLQINGKWTVLQDRPSSPVRDITNSSVKDGLFTYASTGLFERHTSINVTWNNREDRYLQKTSTVEDAPAIAKYGYFPTDVAAYGATTEGQAIRHGRWALLTSQRQTDLVTFTMGLNGFDLLPNDVFRLYDEDYTQLAGEGRIQATPTAYTLKLDRNIKVAANSTIRVMLADGVTTESRTIVSSTYQSTTRNLFAFATDFTALVEDTSEVTETTVVTIDTPFSQPVIADSVYVIESTVVARQFKIMKLSPNLDELTVSVEAVYHNTNKYSLVESGIALPDPVFINNSGPATSVVFAPTNLTFTEEAIKNQDGSITRNLLVNWVPASTGSPATLFRIAWDRDDGNESVINTNSRGVSIPITAEGTYNVYILAYDGAGRAAGTSLSGSYLVTSNTTSELSGVQNFFVSGTIGVVWSANDLHMKWIKNPSDVTDIQGYKVDLLTTSGVLLRSAHTTEPEFIYTLTMNRNDNLPLGTGPRGSIVVSVTPIDLFGRYGVATTKTFINNPPASVSNFTVSMGFKSASIKFSKNTEADVLGYLIWRGETPDFEPSSNNLVADGTVTLLSQTGLDDSTKYYYRIAAYDVFSRNTDGVGLNVSGAVGGETASGASINEYKITGVVFTPNTPEPNALSWTEGTAYASLGSEAGTTWPISAGFSYMPLNSILYVYFEEGETELKATTILTEAIADNKVIVATYRGGTNLEVGFGNAFMDGSLLIAGTVAAAQLAAGSVTADKMQVNNLSAISADLGSITAGQININNNFMVDSLGNMSSLTGTFGGRLLAGVLDLSSSFGLAYRRSGAQQWIYTVPAGRTKVRITLSGGGGGGGGGGTDNNDTGAGGGGGGASNPVTATFDVVEGDIITVVIGAGGVGAPAPSGSNIGNTGGQGESSFFYINNILRLTVAGGSGGAGGRGRGSGGAGGLGANGGSAGSVGANGTSGLTTRAANGGFVTYNVNQTTRANGGRAAIGGANGGQGGAGAVDVNPPLNPGGWSHVSGLHGQDGMMTLEVYEPNTVVLYEEYARLRQACAAANITYTYP